MPREPRAAVEALAAAHVRARAATQAVDVDRRDRAGERVAQLAARDALAEADDPPVLGIGGDQVRALIGPRRRLADVRHPQRAAGRGGAPGRARARPGRARRSPSRPTARSSGCRRRRRSRRRSGSGSPSARSPRAARRRRPSPRSPSRPGRMRPASARRYSRPAAVEAVSSLRSTSSAVGPTITLPKIVGATSTPFETRVGTASTICRTSAARELVEDDQLAAPGRDGEALAAEHAVDLVAVQPGRVDHAPRCQRAAPGSPPGSRRRRGARGRRRELRGAGRSRRARPRWRRPAAS